MKVPIKTFSTWQITITADKKIENSFVVGDNGKHSRVRDCKI